MSSSRCDGEMTSASSGRSGVSARAESGSSASVRLMRFMRSMSTASASRKMLAIAWPAICARFGYSVPVTARPGGSCMRPAPMITSRCAPRCTAGDSGAVCRMLPSPNQPCEPAASSAVAGKTKGMADDASRCACVNRVCTATRCERCQGSMGRAAS